MGQIAPSPSACRLGEHRRKKLIVTSPVKGGHRSRILGNLGFQNYMLVTPNLDRPVRLRQTAANVDIINRIVAYRRFFSDEEIMSLQSVVLRGSKGVLDLCCPAPSPGGPGGGAGYNHEEEDNVCSGSHNFALLTREARPPELLLCEVARCLGAPTNVLRSRVCLIVLGSDPCTLFSAWPSLVLWSESAVCKLLFVALSGPQAGNTIVRSCFRDTTSPDLVPQETATSFVHKWLGGEGGVVLAFAVGMPFLARNGPEP